MEFASRPVISPALFHVRISRLVLSVRAHILAQIVAALVSSSYLFDGTDFDTRFIDVQTNKSKPPLSTACLMAILAPSPAVITLIVRTPVIEPMRFALGSQTGQPQRAVEFDRNDRSRIYEHKSTVCGLKCVTKTRPYSFAPRVAHDQQRESGFVGLRVQRVQRQPFAFRTHSVDHIDHSGTTTRLIEFTRRLTASRTTRSVHHKAQTIRCLLYAQQAHLRSLAVFYRCREFSAARKKKGDNERRPRTRRPRPNGKRTNLTRLLTKKQ